MLCEPLEIEDFVAQSMVEASPVRWHIAHTTWFFEEFLLGREPDYRPVDPAYRHLFNSYYNTVGERTPRGARGLLTRPTVSEIMAYRERVDREVEQRLREAGGDPDRRAAEICELGIQHEQQHQELILTDLKHLLSQNPLRPAYREDAARRGDAAPRNDTAPRSEAAGTSAARRHAHPPEDREPLGWVPHDGGMVRIGHEGPGFSFDNESPRHDLFLPSFALGEKLITNREYLQFMQDGGYRRPELWLDDGWAVCRAQGWGAPLYWENRDGEWFVFTLGGMRSLDPEEPVCHVSFYEADAFARWAGARLPSEAEWEWAARALPLDGNFVESGRLHPSRCASAGHAAPAASRQRPAAAAEERPALLQAFGDVWEWTGSPYRPYPGFRPAAGALGEYNGKFMVNQFVLRGGSAVTPSGHIRATYRNFFYPQARWQFSGIRLAREVS
jgi:ergothioneine biosynthesis protein EgtB